MYVMLKFQGNMLLRKYCYSLISKNCFSERKILGGPKCKPHEGALTMLMGKKKPFT